MKIKENIAGLFLFLLFISFTLSGITLINVAFTITPFTVYGQPYTVTVNVGVALLLLSLVMLVLLLRGGEKSG